MNAPPPATGICAPRSEPLLEPPLLSIGFPVYNGADHLGVTLDSILAQDFGDWELVIVDNASTDATERICRDYVARDTRIRYFRNAENIGAAPNHNRVFEYSRGRYFTWAAHDVVYFPGMLRRCMDVMLAAPPSVVLVYPGCEMIDQQRAFPDLDVYSTDARDPRPHRRVALLIHRLTWINQLRGIIRSDALRKTRLMGSYPSSDYVLLTELAMLGELWEISDVLLRRWLEPKSGAGTRFHRKAWHAWLDPRSRRRHPHLLADREHLVLQFMRAGWRTPARFADRVLCMCTAPFIYYRRILLVLTGRWKRYVEPSVLRHVAALSANPVTPDQARH